MSYFKGGNISKYLIKVGLHDIDKHFRLFLQVLLRVYRNGIIYGDLLKGTTFKLFGRVELYDIYKNTLAYFCTSEWSSRQHPTLWVALDSISQ